MAIFKGAAVAIVTPMHEDGKVNYEKLEELDQGGGHPRHQDRGTDCCCHTDDITGTNLSCNSSCNCLERTHTTFVGTTF